jgi:hypothetical protein
MINQTNGEAVSSFSLQLSESERELLGINAQASGTSVANYIRSFIPELETKQVGRPKKVKAFIGSRTRGSRTRHRRKRRKLIFS